MICPVKQNMGNSIYLVQKRYSLTGSGGGAWPQPPTHPLLFNDGGVRLLRKDFYVLLCSKVFSILEMFPSTWEL